MDIPSYMNRKAFRVVVPRGTLWKLAQQYRVSKPFVCQVLQQERGGDKAREILHTAIERYGGYWEHK